MNELDIDVIAKVNNLVQLSIDQPSLDEEEIEMEALKFVAKEALSKGDMFPKQLDDWIRHDIYHSEGHKFDLFVFLENYMKENPYLSEWALRHAEYVNEAFWNKEE